MLKFVILSILFSTCFKEAFSKETQFDVLKEFYYATNGDSWEFNNEWLSNSDVCKWHGVLCNVNQEVAALQLNQNNLYGTIPSSLGQLRALLDVGLAGNQLYGTIPATLGQLSWIERIDLSNNQLSGAVPSSFGGLNRLSWFKSGNNSPTSISTSMIEPPKLINSMGLCDLSLNPFHCLIPSWSRFDCNARCK